MSSTTTPQLVTTNSLARELQVLDGFGDQTVFISSAVSLVSRAAREAGVEWYITRDARGVDVFAFAKEDRDAILARAGALILDKLLNG